MLIFLTSFLLMLICGSIFILGFHTITRGKELILPDGSKEIEKEIFGEWQLFWEQIIRYNKVFYDGKQLEYKLKILEQVRPAYKGQITFSTKDKKSLFFSTPLTDVETRDIEFILNTNIFKNGEVIFLYDEFPVYKFSEWVRKITNCHICLSGWMGTLCYWIMAYLFSDVFEFTDGYKYPILIIMVFWVVYCVSLAFINKVIKENLDEEKK